MDSSKRNQDWLSNILQFQNLLASTAENSAASGTSLDNLIYYIVHITKSDVGYLFSFNTKSKTWELTNSLVTQDFQINEESVTQEILNHLPELQKESRCGIFQAENIAGFFKLFICPITYRGEITHFLCLIAEAFKNEDAIRHLISLQLSTGFFLYYKNLADEVSEKWGLTQSTGLLDVIQKTLLAGEFTLSCQVLINELQTYLKCSLVAICEYKPSHAKILALSKTADFDTRSSRAKAIANAMEEAAEIKTVLSFPNPVQEKEHSQQLRNHRELQLLFQAKKIISVPLERTSDKEIAACITCIWAEENSIKEIENSATILEASKPYIEATYYKCEQSQPFFLTRIYNLFAKKISKAQRILIVTGLLVFSVILLLPFKYRVSASAELEPVLIRQIQAPFSSTLKQALAQPGSIVKKDQILAVLEEKDILSKLAELTAGRDQALKESASALADKNPSKAKISQLQAEKLSAQIAILEEQKAKLQIISPIAGMVITGDISRYEGSPLKIGEQLLEIAPLDKMYIDIDVPESDVNYVKPGMTVKLRLDAFPEKSWESKINLIIPSAEIKNNKNVFVARANLENFEEPLRPGMKGNAKIATINKPLYWILLHKAWDYLRMLFFW